MPGVGQAGPLSQLSPGSAAPLLVMVTMVTCLPVPAGKDLAHPLEEGGLAPS